MIYIYAICDLRFAIRSHCGIFKGENGGGGVKVRFYDLQFRLRRGRSNGQGFMGLRARGLVINQPDVD